MINATNNPYPESPDPSPSKLDKGGYEGNAETLDAKIDDILAEAKVLIDNTLVGSSSVGSIIPSSVPPAAGAVHAFATQAGTYTNWGGFVVPANTFAFISRSADLVFSISQTTLDVAGKVNISDVINTLTSTETAKPLSAAQGKVLNEKKSKIETWTTIPYLSGSQVNTLGKDWMANADTLSTDIPGTSTKWVERLSGYLDPTDVATSVLVSNTNNPVSGKAVSIKLSVFQPSATVSSILLDGIIRGNLIGANINKLYTIAVFRKKIVAENNLWDISIYEAIGTGFGPKICSWTSTNYVPTNNVEEITLSAFSGSGTSARFLIDWSKIPDGTDLTNKTYSVNGLSNNLYQTIFYTDIIGTPSSSNTSFWNDKTKPSTYLQAGIIDLKLYGRDYSKLYTIAVFRKKIVASGNLWDIAVYEAVGTGFGSKICNWTYTDYVPTNNVEKIILSAYSGSGTYGEMSVDWSQIPDGTDLTGKAYSVNGLNGNVVFKISENDIFSLMLPSTIYGIYGNTYMMYRDGFLQNSRLLNDDYNYTLTSSNGGLSYSDNVISVTTSSNKVITNTIRSLKNLSLISSIQKTVLSKAITFSAKQPLTGINLNTLVIGDSYLDLQWGNGVLEELKSFAVAGGNTVTYKGTRTSYGNLGEARASWAESTFLTRYVPIASRVAVNGDPTSANMCSPFVFSTDDTVANKYFSFSQYLSTNSITNVDNIVFFLGMNGGNGSGINTMIADIKTALPNVKIFICTVPSHQRVKSTDMITAQLSREVCILNYIKLFDGRTAEGIYLLPINAIFHRLYSYNNSSETILKYPNSMVANQEYTTDHHPNGSGAKLIADMIYNYLMYANS